MPGCTTSAYMHCCHRTPRGKAGDACHVEFKWLHRVIWLLVLMPAAHLFFFFFSSLPLVQKLITDISCNPRKDKLLLKTQLLCNHSKTWHFLGRKEQFFMIFAHADCYMRIRLSLQCCQIYSYYHVCMKSAMQSPKNITPFITLSTSLLRVPQGSTSWHKM